jgi:hypothetical protein
MMHIATQYSLPLAEEPQVDTELQSLADHLEGAKASAVLKERSATLAERAVLMAFSAGCPGNSRTDHAVTRKIKAEQKLGSHAGNWGSTLYPENALKLVNRKINEARNYHNAVTLRFADGVGILPAALIVEYGNRMRQFKGELDNLMKTTFLHEPKRWIDWARKEHNGNFNPDFYPGCESVLVGDKMEIVFNEEVFKEEMTKKFYLNCDPMPVPDAAHFVGTVASLLGTDLQSVSNRVEDATRDAVKKLFVRMIEPVAHMVETLGKESPRIFETLTGNIKEIAELAPKLNIMDDPEVNEAAASLKQLADQWNAESLRKGDEKVKLQAKEDAEAVLKRLSGYKM